MEIVSDKPETITTLYEGMLKHRPNILANFVPSNKNGQKDAFRRGEIINPDHSYSKLDGVDFGENMSSLNHISLLLTGHPDMNPKYKGEYEEFVKNYKKKTEFLEIAHAYNYADSEEEKMILREQYMKLNIELFGEPDEQVYRSLLQEKLSQISKKQLSKRGEEIRQELFTLVEFNDSGENTERFKPSIETVEWVKGVVDSLYAGMLSHVPDDKKTFSVVEVQSVLQEILDQEFGEAAKEWTADIEPAMAIRVQTAEKRIIIPENRNGITANVLKDLIVHEIGVHVLRSMTGEETDFDLLAQGLNGYYDSEEGLGMVMQQARSGGFREVGIDPYIIAGAAYFDNKNFREIFELKWRLSLLESTGNGRVVTELEIAKAKKSAYGHTLRIFRGTDELPLFKDLAYYNGSVGMWRHLESIKDDDVKFMFVLMGKADPSNINHERIQYETATI